MAKNKTEQKQQYMICALLDDLVPEDHLVRKLDRYVDWSFIYDICDPLYSNRGTNRVDPVVLFKMMFINIIFGYHSMRKTCEDIKVNLAYRWFLGLGFEDTVPDHSTFSQNYRRKFKDNNVSIRIFEAVIDQLISNGVIDPSVLFIDGTHVKANANKHKDVSREVQAAAKRCKKLLDEDVARDREEHGKKALKEKKNQAPEIKEIKASRSDPDCGYFHKGEKEKCFAYNANTSCDRHGYILGMSLDPGNIHDSQAVYHVLDFIDHMPFSPEIEKIVADAGYSNPELAHYVSEKDKELIVPKKRTRSRGKGKYGKFRYEYDEKLDAYVCPQGCLLRYCTTNREGRRIYKSSRKECEACPFRASKCTESKDGVKTIERHIWQEDLDKATQRASETEKETYQKRKQTIEKVFADGKRRHGLDYTLYTGFERVYDNLMLIFTGMNLKKLCTYLGRMQEAHCAQNSCFEHQNEETLKAMGIG